MFSLNLLKKWIKRWRVSLRILKSKLVILDGIAAHLFRGKERTSFSEIRNRSKGILRY